MILDAVRKFTDYKQPTTYLKYPKEKLVNIYRDLAHGEMIRDNWIETKVEAIDDLTSYENGRIAARRAWTTKQRGMGNPPSALISPSRKKEM